TTRCGSATASSCSAPRSSGSGPARSTDRSRASSAKAIEAERHVARRGEMGRSTTSLRVNDELLSSVSMSGKSCSALNYAAAHHEEIEARIRTNDRALDEAERVAGERKRFLV